MDYKTSLLIYRTQTINVNSLWSSKLRLIKSLTPLFRKLTEQDLLLIDQFNSEHEALAAQVNHDLSPLVQARNTEREPHLKKQLSEQISTRKIKYLEDYLSLNKTTKNDKLLELEAKTKLLVILYCTWSEAVFIKLKHTPHGLSIDKREDSYGNQIGIKWANLIETIISRIPLNSNDGDISLIMSELKELSDKYIVEQSKLRNKIAHGQWRQSLNSNNNDLIIETSLKIAKLDIVKLDVSFEIHNFITQILESILESNDPNEMIINRHDSYLFLKHRLDKFIEKTKDWNVKSRSIFLKQRNVDTRSIGLNEQLKLEGLEPIRIQAIIDKIFNTS